MLRGPAEADMKLEKEEITATFDMSLVKIPVGPKPVTPVGSPPPLPGVGECVWKSKQSQLRSLHFDSHSSCREVRKCVKPY